MMLRKSFAVACDAHVRQALHVSSLFPAHFLHAHACNGKIRSGLARLWRKFSSRKQVFVFAGKRRGAIAPCPLATLMDSLWRISWWRADAKYKRIHCLFLYRLIGILKSHYGQDSDMCCQFLWTYQIWIIFWCPNNWNAYGIQYTLCDVGPLARFSEWALVWERQGRGEGSYIYSDL